MSDDQTHQDRLRGALFPDGKPPLPAKKDSDDGGEGSCAAFGYLRGIRDASSSIEFRLRSGNSMWFPYSWLGPWRYNPSEGLLLKFSGDGRRLPGTDPGQQPRQASRRRLDQPHARGIAAVASAVDS